MCMGEVFNSTEKNSFIDKSLNIDIMYHNKDLIPINLLEKGDWIDLRASKEYKLFSGSFYLIDLGISVKLPDGYEAHIVPRSSSFKNWGIIQTNGIGIIDNSYCGENDIWMMPVLATRSADIHVNDRICQFRIVEKMPSNIKINTVDHLNTEDRGGIGSTGIN